jgi:hypothetical protein
LVKRTATLPAATRRTAPDFRGVLDGMSCQLVILVEPWIDAPAYDKDLYKARRGQCVQPAQTSSPPQYEKTLRNYAAVVAIGRALLWLRIRATPCSDSAIDVGADVVVDLVVDGAVDVSATFVVHVDESTVIILVNIATTASKSSIPRS